MLTRRRMMIASAAGGTGALSALAAAAQEGGENVLTGGDMALSQATKVADKLWIGPKAARSDINSPPTGAVFMGDDTQVDYYWDGSSWNAMGVGSSTEGVPSVNTESMLVGGEGPIEGVDAAALDSNNRIVGGGGAEQLVLDTTNDEYLTVVRGSTDYYYGNVDPSTVSGEDVGPYDYYASVDETAEGWVQTENSPYVGTGSQSHVIEIPGTYEKLEITFAQCENTSGSSQGLYMRINEVVGDGTNLEYYYELLTDGTTNNQATDFTLVSSIGDGKGVQPSIELSGVNSTAGTIQAYGPSGEGSGNAGLLTGTFDNNPESGVSSIEIRGGSGTIAVQAMVRGWTL